MTCSRERFDELSKNDSFETKILYSSCLISSCHPHPRISELDAKAIVDDFYLDYLNHCSPIKHPGLASAAWLNKQGRALLDKLNGESK